MLETLVNSYYLWSLVAIGLVYGLYLFVQKYPTSKKYLDIAVDVFAYIESNYKNWGIQGNEKRDFFVKEFISNYYQSFGKVPVDRVIQEAIALVEQLVAAQNSAVKVK